MTTIKCINMCGKRFAIDERKGEVKEAADGSKSEPSTRDKKYLKWKQNLFKSFKVENVVELAKVYKCKTCRKKANQATLTSSKEEVGFHGLIGCEDVIKKIDLLQKHGNKAIFVAGYHGLGKSTLVEALAKEHGAELIRFQMTEMTSEIDLIGGLDLKTGEFVYSNFVKALMQANKDPSKKYYVLIDEFTRGRDEALNILFPLLAEKKLIINSPYAKETEILVSDNVKIFATGNLHDVGQREIGQAELDRYNVVVIKPIKDTIILNHIISSKVGAMNSETKELLIKFYMNSWTKHEEARILAMSIRTFIEAAKIALEINKKKSALTSVKEALELTYFGTSHAVLNPNYARTYQEMIQELN